MTSKKYFFVHLAIFVAVSCVFAVAGVSSYQDYQRAQGGDSSRPEAAAERTAPAQVLAVAPFGPN